MAKIVMATIVIMKIVQSMNASTNCKPEQHAACQN
jgi:hypothetical protein